MLPPKNIERALASIESKLEDELLVQRPGETAGGPEN
jgi:hypothetical protein